MRSLHLLALATVITAAGAACGGDGNGNGNGNEDPVADFTFACTLLNCTFTDASTDDSDVASWSWNFDDGTPPVTTQNATHAFAAAGTYDVALTVTDDEGADATTTKQVVVTTTPPNQPPVASFTATCSSLDCTFTNTSTDSDGTFTSSWDFDDGSPASTETSPVHTYAVTGLTTFDVVLTVTDDDGESDSETVQISVAPPADLQCGQPTDCVLTLNEAKSITVTLVSSDCQLEGNTFKVQITEPGVAPVEEVLFTDGCHTPANTSFQLQGGKVFLQNTEITAQVISSAPTLVLPPTLRLRAGSAYPNWTLEFDDGAFAGPLEPDFDDLIISIVANP